MLACQDVAGRNKLCADATGVESPFCGVLVAKSGFRHFALTMTPVLRGNREGITVPNDLPFEAFFNAFETGTLSIVHNQPLKSSVMIEISSLQLATTAAGNFLLHGGNKGHHADMAVALVLRYCVSEHLATGNVGNGRLSSWH